MRQKNCFSILFIVSSLLLINCQSISGILATVDPNDHGHGDNHTHADTQTHTDAPPQPDPHPGSGAVHQPGWLFSFVMPEDWEIEDEGDEYSVIRGPAKAGFQPTLIIAMISDPTMLELWTASAQDDTISVMKGYSQISEDFLETDAGETFFRWEFTATQNGSKYHFIFYMYDAGSWKLVISYMRLDRAGAEDDALVDAATRSVLYR